MSSAPPQPPPLTAAPPDLDGDGPPFSHSCGDIHHAAVGGPQQARRIFLAGADLPARWRNRSFTVLESGFGYGLNFICTLQAWRAEPGRRLHYVSIERHPPTGEQLAGAWRRWPQLQPLAQSLLQQWPLLLPGMHRLDFGDVALTLCFGDAGEVLPQLQLSADALYLDGFAPEKNPRLWSQQICAEAHRLAAPGARLATWCAAAEVHRRLAEAGFAVEKRPGCAAKQEMIVAFKGAATSAVADTGANDGGGRSARIAVIGAGVAGAAVAHALQQRRREVIVIDAAANVASGASGNLAGVFRPQPTRDDNRLARTLRAGFLLGRRRFANLAAAGARLDYCGVLQLARDDKHEATQRAVIAEQQPPPAFCRYVDVAAASELAAAPTARGGWWFAGGGWINPPSLCRALLAACEVRPGFAVQQLQRRLSHWRLIAANGEHIDADEVILANGVGVSALSPTPIRSGRGLVSHIPATALPACDIVITRQGYLTPAEDGLRCLGASLAIDDVDSAPRQTDHAENLDRLRGMLPACGAGLDPAQLDGRVGFRPMSPDRLPLVGPLQASDGLWIINGFGARGLVFAAICAELLADQICNTPPPLPQDLINALAPSRFAARRR